MTPEALRAALPRLYESLLARHGRPTPIQLEAAEPQLAGRDCLLCAPTASGKTEAWMGPLAERHLPMGSPDTPRLLVISPTRALVNDLYRRLEPRLGPAGIAIGRWTGDHHDGGRMHTVTLLTPEGLDSRLARAGPALDGVSALVVDEIHVLDGTARGDQLRILLERLRARTPVQVVAASATVGDPIALGARYLRNPVVVQAGTPRKVVGRIERSVDPVRISRCLQDATDAGLRKVLLFCNSRNDVERLSSFLRGRAPFGGAVFAHHGSLARPARLAAELRFLETPSAICVATSTMEMGVDVGDVDLVALVGLPPSAASLLQRVGRGGRRGAVSNVLAFVEFEFEEQALRALLTAGVRGEWLDGPYVFRPGVLVQQALSALHERRSRTIDGAALSRRLPATLAADWPAERIDRVLMHAEGQGWLTPAAGATSRKCWGIGPKAEGAWIRGTLHANLAAAPGVAVVDSLTGEEVGRVATGDGADLQLGGRGRRSLHATAGRIVTENASSVTEARFNPSPPAPVPGAMAGAILRHLGIPAPCRADLPTGRALFHGLGTAGGAVLAGCWPKGVVQRAGPLAVVFNEWPEGWPEPPAAAAAIARLHRSIGRLLAMGAFHAALPEEERGAAVGALCELAGVEALLRTGPPSLHQTGELEVWAQAAVW